MDLLIDIIDLWFHFSFKPFCIHKFKEDHIHTDSGWVKGQYCNKCGRKKYN